METATNNATGADVESTETNLGPSRSISVFWGREVGIIYENEKGGKHISQAYVYPVENVILVIVAVAVCFWILIVRRRKSTR